MTKSSSDQEEWVDVCWSGDEETSHESSTTDSEFEIIGSSSNAPLTARAHVVATGSPTPSSADRISSLATRKSGTFKDYFQVPNYDDMESESNRTSPRSLLDSLSRSIIIKTTIDKSTTSVVRRRLPRGMRAKHDLTRRRTLKSDDHNDASQRSSKSDHEFEGPPSCQPPLQQEGDDAAATPNEDPDFEALLEGPWKSCYLDEVD